MVLRISFAVLMRLLDVRSSTIPRCLRGHHNKLSYVVWLSNPVKNSASRAIGERILKQYQKGLILAQNERWRRGLGMQVEREPARGTAANGVGTRR